MKGSKRCHFYRNCHRMATGALMHRMWSFRDNREVFMGGGIPLCQEHLVRHTHAELAAQWTVEELILSNESMLLDRALARR